MSTFPSTGCISHEKKHNIFDAILPLEEQALLESVENGEWKSVANLEEEKATNFLRKDAGGGISSRPPCAKLDR